MYLLSLDSGLPANIQLDIDGDRETERIYSLFNLYMGKLEKMQGECGPWAPTVGKWKWVCHHRSVPREPLGFLGPVGVC